MNNIIITDFQLHHQPSFDQFNRQWIEADFEIEDVDEYVLSNPKEAILDEGGAILMALYNGEPAGTVGLKKIDDSTFEFTKMAVGESFRRKGIAEALSYASFTKAKELGAHKVILYSNSQLTPAIRLYEKLGFKHLPVGIGEYKRSDVKMEIEVSKIEVPNLKPFNFLNL